jgi:hypothetical protein
MKLRVTAEQVRRLIAPVADAVGAARGATGGLLLLRAVVAGAARDGGVPRHAVAELQRLPGPVAFESFAQFHDAPDRLVTHDDRQRDGQLAFPQVDISAADAGHLGAHQRGAGFNG